MTRAEVVSIHGGHDPGKPNGDLIEDLETMLADARTGKLRAMIYGTVDANGISATGWVGEAGDRTRLAAILNILWFRYTRKLEAGE